MTGPGRPAAHLKGRSVAEDRQGGAILPRDAKPTCRRPVEAKPLPVRQPIERRPQQRMRTGGTGNCEGGPSTRTTKAATRLMQASEPPGSVPIEVGSDMPACRSSVPCSAARACIRPRPLSANRRRSRHPHGDESAPVRRCPAYLQSNATCMQRPMPFRLGSSQCAWFWVTGLLYRKSARAMPFRTVFRDGTGSCRIDRVRACGAAYRYGLALMFCICSNAAHGT